MSDHPQPGDLPPEGPRPDPAAPPPSAPDGTGPPVGPQPYAPGAAPVPPPPYAPGAAPLPPPPYAPGAAPIPPQPRPEYPATSQFPPVNYAPPGRTPDYGQQYAPGDYPAPPPGYPGFSGYPPPPPAPRRSNVPLIAVIVAVALLLCGGVATAGILVAHAVTNRAHKAIAPLTDPTLPDLPTDIPNLPGLPTDLPTGGVGGHQIDVTYQVTGDGPADILYVPKLGAGPTQVDDVKLPWSFHTTMQTPALVSIIAMRAGTTDGKVTCRALVDGKEVKRATSSDSALATAACTYFALN